jgi:(S)-3,5-dihydroxyphenylglycine transaminase
MPVNPQEVEIARSACTLGDYERLAKRVLPGEIWDFIAGGAGEERTVAANTSSFAAVRLAPRVLTGASCQDTKVSVLGREWAAPVAVAPMAYHTLVHPEGELATVQAAADAGLPVVVSTFAGRTFDELASAAHSPLWLQIYCFRDWSVTEQLVRKAERAGFEALMLTVDTPLLGRRLRDLRNGFRLPPGIVPANLPPGDYSSPSQHSRTEMDASLDWSVISRLRSLTDLHLLLKGILTAEDALLAIAAGVDGVVVSNHGGRQLDGAPATLDVLPDVVAAIAARCPVLIDGGVRRGTDVLAALALGADAVMLGRPVLYSLAVAGRRGVADALEILVGEFADAMTLTGTPSIPTIGPSLLFAPSPVLPPQPRADGRPGIRIAETGARNSDLRMADLHASLSDPMLDVMTFLNEITDRYPRAISFAPGRPHEGAFDVEDIFKHLRAYIEYLSEQGASPDRIRTTLFQYGPTAGHIRGLVADSLREDEGIDVPPESIVVTVGCQEAMLLTLRALFADPRDVLLVSCPCYVGIVGAARLLGIQIATVEEQPDGISGNDLDQALRAELRKGNRPRALYLVPDYSNPSGNTMAPEVRQAVLALAERYDIVILEDSPYRLVSPGRQIPTLKAIDTGRRVVHLGSFAKSAFPGVRLGYVIADQLVTDGSGKERLLADELAKIKSMVTVNSPSVSQAIVAGILLGSGGRLSQANSRTAARYGDALQLAFRQLDLHFPVARRQATGVTWNRPAGGFFLTVRVPFPADDAALARSAEQHNVIWTPMRYFFPDGRGGHNAIRLSVSSLEFTEIEDGIARFARFIDSEIGARPVR